jgi:hypothetical protein
VEPSSRWTPGRKNSTSPKFRFREKEADENVKTTPTAKKAKKKRF